MKNDDWQAQTAGGITMSMSDGDKCVGLTLPRELLEEGVDLSNLPRMFDKAMAALDTH